MSRTSDERREVAERLRICARETNGTYDFTMYLSHWVGFDGVTDDNGNPFTIQADRREAELTLEKLADLIDPVCKVKTRHDYGATTLRVCSECGWPIVADMSYCPGCGARLVSDDDQ